MCEVAKQSLATLDSVLCTDSMALAAVDRRPGPLECGVCCSVWTEPITLPCGHTYCKKCVGAEGPRSPRAIICKQCGKTCVSCCISNNILLANVTRKWFAQENCLKHVKDSNITDIVPSNTQAKNDSYVQGASECSYSPEVTPPSRSQAVFRKRRRSQSCCDLEQSPPCKHTHHDSISSAGESDLSEAPPVISNSAEDSNINIQCRTSEQATTGQNHLSTEAALLDYEDFEYILDYEDFECVLCYRLLCEPLTTPCGHTFCRNCLYRSLDHSNICPLCKSSLVEFVAERRQAVNVAVNEIMQLYFPQQYAERTAIHSQELESLRDDVNDVPVFVLLSAFPSVTCVLHIFEPRYKLMIRQTMESGLRQFAMCPPSSDANMPFSEYGCMLEIKDVQYFPDGRCIIHTTGGRRFRVESRGKQNGYHTGKLQYLTDTIPESSDEIAEVTELHTLVHTIAAKWIQSMSRTQWQRVLHTLGDMPEVEADFVNSPNGPSWIWWLASILPLDTQAQQSILVMTTLKSRLVALKRILGYVIKRQALTI